MDVELHEYNWDSAAGQIESLRAVRRERSEKDVARTLKELESAAPGWKKRDALPGLMLQGVCVRR